MIFNNYHFKYNIFNSNHIYTNYISNIIRITKYLHHSILGFNILNSLYHYMKHIEYRILKNSRINTIYVDISLHIICYLLLNIHKL